VLGLTQALVNPWNQPKPAVALTPHSYNSSVSSISASAHLESKTLMAEIFEQFIINKSGCHQVKNECSEVQDEALATDISKGKGKD
jgi:hypothetical protein